MIKLERDNILKHISFILFVGSLVLFLYWFCYDYEKGEGSALLIFALITFINLVVQNGRCWAFEDKKVGDKY